MQHANDQKSNPIYMHNNHITNTHLRMRMRLPLIGMAALVDHRVYQHWYQVFQQGN